MPLIHLIYVSTAREEFDNRELQHILEASARNNTPRGITGMLIYAGGSFMQILEGEAAAVDETYRRITQDPRHHDIFLIERETIQERDFGDWHMGFRRIGIQDIAAHPAYTPFLANGHIDPARIGAKPGAALDMLKDFACSPTRR